MNKQARARWRDFEWSNELRRMNKSNPKQTERFMNFVDKQYKDRIVPGALKNSDKISKARKEGLQKYRQKIEDMAKAKAAENAKSTVKDTAKKVFEKTTKSTAKDAADTVKSVAKSSGGIGKKLMLAGGGAALLGTAALGTNAAVKAVKKHRTNKNDENQKTASEILEDFADIKSRYEVYEKEANEDMMNEMDKEARARWRDFASTDNIKKMHKSNPEQAKKFTSFVSEQYKNRIIPGQRRYAEAVKKAVGSGSAATAASSAVAASTDKLKKLKELKNSKAFKRVRPILTDTWRGAALGATTGGATGAMSEYRDREDNQVHRLKNTLHGVKKGAVAGAISGAAHGMWTDKTHAIGRYDEGKEYPESKPYKKRYNKNGSNNGYRPKNGNYKKRGNGGYNNSGYNNKNFKTASIALDEMVKEAMNAKMVGGAIGGYDALRKIGKGFSKAYKANGGNFIQNVAAGAKNVGLKGLERGAMKTIGGMAIGAGIDGVANAINKKDDDPNQSYN